MDYEAEIAEAAHRAERATWEVMAGYRDGTASEEPAITGGLATALRIALTGKIAGLTWKTHVMKASSGKSAEESATGADLLMHIKFDTTKLKYSKGVLIQAKRVEPGVRMNKAEHKTLVEQCEQMLGITPCAFVFDYTKHALRCGSAIAIAGSTNRYLHSQCAWTSYRFFLEFFRCFIGDPRITGAEVSDLPAPPPVPTMVRFIVSQS
jgi:hypothetical protein